MGVCAGLRCWVFYGKVRVRDRVRAQVYFAEVGGGEFKFEMGCSSVRGGFEIEFGIGSLLPRDEAGVGVRVQRCGRALLFREVHEDGCINSTVILWSRGSFDVSQTIPCLCSHRKS